LTRYGLTGKLIDLERAQEVPAVQAIRRRMHLTEKRALHLGLDVEFQRLEGILAGGNTAMRQIAAYQQGRSLTAIHREMAFLTMGQPAVTAPM